MEPTTDGGCDCRGVRYRMHGRPLFVHCCHCRWCQRETGSAFVLNAMIETARVTLLAGEPDIVLTPSESGGGQRIARCRTCRIAVWSHYSGGGERIRFVRVGTLDDPDRFPPAPAQGAIGLEIRADDSRTADLIRPLDHTPTAIAVHAERALLGALDGSCRTAIGAVSRLDGDTLTLTGEILSPDGQISIRDTLMGSAQKPEALGHELGQILRDKAGSDFLKLFPR